MLVITLFLLALALLGLIGVGIYAMQYTNYDKIMPNVYIQGIDVGGMTQEEAKAALEASLESDTAQSLNVNLPDCTLTFTPEQSSVLVDVDQAIAAAYSYGRNSTNPFAISRAIKTAQRHRTDIDLSTAVTLDTTYISQMITDTAATVTCDMVESQVAVDTENRVISVTIGIPGRSLNTETLYTLVCNAFTTGDYSDIDFDYTMSYPATIALDRLYEQLSCDPQDAYYDPDSGMVVAEAVGYTPTMDLESANQALALASPGDILTFTFDQLQPSLTQSDLEAVLFRDTLYSYGTVYAYNTGRTENLRLACQAIDGTVIQPGDVFSFNDVVGERTAAKGYQEAVVYVNGNSEPALGGGICQVASTIYYCCLYADLEIVEREEHMYFVTYVPGGLDATVYWGSVDFKFRNSTDYPLRVDAWLDNGMVNIALVGTDVTGNYVEINNTCVSTTPYQYITEYGSGTNVSGYTGYVYTITRNVYDSAGNLIRTDSTEDLDAMGGGCGTSTYEKRDQVTYTGGWYY